MANLRVISADSHVMEPAGLWEERLDKKFRDQHRASSRMKSARAISSLRLG